nr:hypothetical protein CFP56_01800 [Quercus suber]
MCFGISSIGQDWALRELVIKSLDQLKTGKGPATVKTIAGTMSVILLLSLMSIVKIQNKGTKLGTMSPMDQVLWRTYLLKASLMGQTAIRLLLHKRIQMNYDCSPNFETTFKESRAL